jgi:hypothetical protein
VTPRVKCLKAFLASAVFLKEEQAGLIATAIAELTFSVSCVRCHYFPYGPSYHRGSPVRFTTTPEELPSFHERGQAPSSFHRIGRSFRLGLIDWPYRCVCSGRSRTFIGQCCQPFCSGDATIHSDGPRDVTKYRRARERIRLSELQQVREHGPPSEPKRDTSQTVFTWPLRHRSLPSDAGPYPLSGFE